jgi:protocatechuate 3,4-dioxygenase beta subunit
MNKKHIAIAGALLVVGGGAVYWKTRGGGEDKKAAVQAGPDGGKRAQRVQSAPSGGGGPSEEQRALVDDDPVGTLRLEGQVLGAGDEPVGGALVTIDSNPPRSATSESDGSFFVDKLLAREYTLVARASAGVAGPLTARLGTATDPIILRLRAASSVDVTVVSSQGAAAVAGAAVELRGIATARGTTGADGVARLEGVIPGGYAVSAAATGFARQHAWLQVPDGGARATVRIELRRGAPVAGRVVDPDGKPVGGALVVYSGASSWGQQGDPRRDGVESDPSGAFRFDALPVGTFRFQATKKGFASGSSKLVTLDGERETTGVEVRLQAGATLRGQVVSAAGQPVAGARVRAVVSRDSMFFGDIREGYADDGGRFEVAGLPRAAVEAAAIHESASSAIVPVDLSVAPFDREITLKLDVDGTIAGMVVDKSGEPIEGAQVLAWPDMATSRDRMATWRVRGRPEELTDAGGRFALHGMDPGDYELRAVPSVASGTSFGNAMQRDPVKAKTGDTAVRIVLPPDGGIKGKVTFADGSAPGLFTVGLGWSSGQPFSDDSGAFEVNDLAPRSYTVTIRGAGFDARQLSEVVVAEGKSTDLGTITVKKGRTISGRVVDADGRAVSGASVRAGKMLFGDGSSSKAAGGGPPMARNQKETVTDEAGDFTMYGVGRGDLSIVAEHDAAGRSSSMLLPGSSQSVTGLSLVLQPFGSLEGTVTKGGKPAADVIVSASSLTASGAVFAVGSGEDGVFRFDRLAPDRYKVSAMTGRMPMLGMGFHSKTAEVVSGKTGHVDLVIDSGSVKLTLELVETTGKKINFAYVAAVKGKVKSKTSRALQAEIGALGDGFWKQAFSIGGMPVTLTELTPGAYSLCAVPYPVEVTGMAGIMDYGEREGDNLAVYCMSQSVTAEPLEQKARLEMTAPPFVPPPADGT